MLGRFCIGFIAATVALTGAASAIQVKREVDAKGEAAKVWADIGGWCAISTWHPAIAKCEETEAGGKKHRTLTLKDGGVIKETMLKSGKTSYTYRIDESPLPVSQYTATFAVVGNKGAGKGSKVMWSAKFAPKGKAADAEKVIGGVFDGGLGQIKSKY
jgi:hypothetical protein